MICQLWVACNLVLQLHTPPLTCSVASDDNWWHKSLGMRLSQFLMFILSSLASLYPHTYRPQYRTTKSTIGLPTIPLVLLLTPAGWTSQERLMQSTYIFYPMGSDVLRCVCVCVRVFVHACVHACMHACVCVQLGWMWTTLLCHRLQGFPSSSPTMVILWTQWQSPQEVCVKDW